MCLLSNKGETLAQRVASLPRQRVRGKLVWVWWVSGSMQSQCTRVMLMIFDFNGTPGRDKFLRILHIVGTKLSCKLGRPLQGMGTIDSPTHTPKDFVESDLSTLNHLAGVVLLLISSLRLILRSSRCEGGVGGPFKLAGQGVTKIALGRLE
eukprot:523439-Pelagomonas_calceolata.AAC.1